MLYAQFLQRSALNPEVIIEACGDRAVVILDGRMRLQTARDIASDECAKRGYVAWQLMRGESFTRSIPASPVVHL